MIFEYFINLDERGEFYADVRNEAGDTVLELHGHDVFESGFMQDKHDIAGLADYMYELGVMTSSDRLELVG